MKKIVFTGVLCLFVVCSFSQKKNVSAAKNELKNTPPNYAEARNQIKSALTDPETANDAETWYTAGLIESTQFDDQKKVEILGKKPDDAVMYDALQNILPYFLKAAELDKVPDAKGKIKPRFTKDICANIRANRPYYVNAGIFAYEKKDYKQAYENFKMFGDIPTLDIFKDEKWNIVKGDTTETQIRYNAGVMAAMIPDHQAAIAIYKEIKDNGYVENTVFKESDIYQRLAIEYSQIKDSTNFENIIKEGLSKFPGEEFYVQNLINLNINTGKFSDAIDYLKQAIEQHPEEAQFYDVLGQVYEQSKNSDEAINSMKKAVELEPDNVDFLSHIGRVYFNLGVEQRAADDNLSSTAKAKGDVDKSLEYFKQAMPFWEKVFQMNPKSSDAIFALRSIYYKLSMNDQYKKMDDLFSNEEKEK